MNPSIEKREAGSVRELLPLAAPIFFSQAIDMTMIFCDRYFLAMLGKEELAATLTGGILTFLFTTLMIGTFGQIAPLVAQYKGAGQTRHSVRVVHQGLILSLIVPPLLLAAAYFLSPQLFAFFGHEAALAETELNYFRILSLTVITTSIRTVFANFFIGIGRSLIVTIASFSAVALNIPLAYGLIFGMWGMPKLGMEGAAIGTVIASCIPVILLALAFLSKTMRNEYATGSRIQLDTFILANSCATVSPLVLRCL
jgi:MATE family multidrug resistance protein